MLFSAAFSEAYGESKEACVPPVLLHMVQSDPEAVFLFIWPSLA